jgi:hypothetical protein
MKVKPTQKQEKELKRALKRQEQAKKYSIKTMTYKYINNFCK